MTSEERPWVLGSHIGTLLGYAVAFGSFIVPLIIWLSKKEESEVIAMHAKASLNFQLSMLLYTFIAGIGIFFLIGIPFLIIIPIVNLICVILATIEADKGKLYRYPLCINFVK
ncbi:hypothetical protein EV198_3319 [Roseivirga ehrenbergii]|uniref:DUF4870 domain-containing protein n=3 Tax=Roseivirga TaxID=290180 RepID=A0A0L8AHX8_9BACT|nr:MULTISPECIES: DUF4870 domain-containing protein [Roseivirga]KOF01876.1 hypothetical protein OB69_16225 [Roseivirga seohaensis subsp. aquiponti]KYG71456.1 hypothetical protein MB14_11830 [Roseivirga ehrenbergii]KYG85355.1 hypothetical protein AWW67_16740 [Roseivirga seohaensis]TCK99491.1 hypothetical protein EV198_3319 [Roseivirga ehrenbergii]|tara:strand:- start:4249 stop:4587 length:339 start_codon:yes stop_codon:yes gene_type:complete